MRKRIDGIIFCIIRLIVTLCASNCFCSLHLFAIVLFRANSSFFWRILFISNLNVFILFQLICSGFFIYWSLHIFHILKHCLSCCSKWDSFSLSFLPLLLRTNSLRVTDRPIQYSPIADIMKNMMQYFVIANYWIDIVLFSPHYVH